VQETRLKYPEQQVPVEEHDNSEPHVVIGKILNHIPEYPAKLYKSALFRHALITGTTGSGKSYTASRIAERVCRELKIPVLLVDWHGEHSEVLSEYTRIEPRELPLQLLTGEPSDLSVIASIFELTPPQEYILEKVIKQKDPAKITSIESLLDSIDVLPEESSWFRESKLSLHRKLSVLARDEYSDLFKVYRAPGTALTRLTTDQRCPLIVDVSVISDLSVKRLYASLLVKRVVNYSIRQQRPLLVIIEEAQNYLSRQAPVKPICELLREIRKFHVGLVILAQSISQLVEDALANTNTKIIHSIKSKQDLEVVEKAIYIDYSFLSLIPYLEVGEAVYTTIGLKKPVLIRVE
jgi:DNA helicase HerA-like ATPase